MASILHFRIFDSGIDFTNISNSEYAKDVISSFTKLIASAALSTSTSMAFMFGTNNYDSTLDTNPNKFYFGNNKIEVEDGDNVELSKTAFISFFQKYNYDQEENFKSESFSSILVPSSFDLDDSYMITNPNTLTVNDSLTALRELESRLLDMEQGTPVEQDIIHILYNTFLQFNSRPGHYDDTVSPSFIPISNYNGYCSRTLEWINNKHESFFTNLAAAADKMSIKTEDLRLYVLLMSIYPDNVEELPMSTIKSVSLY